MEAVSSKPEHVEEQPLLFTGEMVRAILDKTKTETRRPLKPQPVVDGQVGVYDFISKPKPAWRWTSSRLDAGYCHTDAAAFARLAAKASRYRRGTVIWVRETWAAVGYRCPYERHVSGLGGIRYRATWDRSHGSCWRPSIHMPRAACRILLRVDYNRVERVQETTEADAKAEGVADRDDFRRLWDSVYQGALCWEANPWVDVIQFELTEVLW